MKKEIINEFKEILILAEKNSFKLVEEKEIPYGLSLKFQKNGELTTLNIYFSKKKGISHVVSGKKKNKSKSELQTLINMKDHNKSHDWKEWVGTDESGKGDFFGPLVTAGFCCNEEIEKDLLARGIKDSKAINDKKIMELSRYIYARYKDRVEVVLLKPETYNRMYMKFRRQGKKLNELLAWMHSRVILNLKEKRDFHGAVIDKFASDKVLKNSLEGIKNIELRHFHKAESDIAVAAASVIARYHFLIFLEKYEKYYKLEIPKGASKKVIKNGSILLKKYGEEELKKISKQHFKTFKKIIDYKEVEK